MRPAVRQSTIGFESPSWSPFPKQLDLNLFSKAPKILSTQSMTLTSRYLHIQVFQVNFSAHTFSSPHFHFSASFVGAVASISTSFCFS